jgi:hypothetical protein
MAFSRGPNIITDGLALYYDAANLNSYVAPSNVVFDLSKNKNNGTLINDVGFTSDNLGSFEFDGVDSRIHMGDVLSTYGNFDSYTANFWIKLNSLTSNNALLGNALGSTTVGNISIFSDSIDDTVRVRIVVWVTNSTGGNTAVSLYPGPYGSSYVDINLQEEYWTKWRYITIRFDSEIEVDTARRYRIFIDGESKATTIRNTDLNNSINTSRRIGVRGTTTNPFDGNISLIQIYNRPLSNNEIEQNYNATKSRYGL